MSIAKGLDKAAENAAGMGADTMQIFSRNPRGSSYKDYTKEEISRFQKIREENGMKTVLAHAPYTMNLASAKEEVYEFANTVIREDVARMDALGIEKYRVPSGQSYRDRRSGRDQKYHCRSGSGTHRRGAYHGAP